jgi:hypothetical protein
MKKTLVWFGAAFLAAGIAACGGGSKKEETTPMVPASEVLPDAGPMEGAPPTGMTGNPCGGAAPAAGNPCSK